MRKSWVQVPFPALKKHRKHAAFELSGSRMFLWICEFGDSLGTLSEKMQYFIFNLAVQIKATNQNDVRRSILYQTIQQRHTLSYSGVMPLFFYAFFCCSDVIVSPNVSAIVLSASCIACTYLFVVLSCEWPKRAATCFIFYYGGGGSPLAIPFP